MKGIDGAAVNALGTQALPGWVPRRTTVSTASRAAATAIGAGAWLRGSDHHLVIEEEDAAAAASSSSELEFGGARVRGPGTRMAVIIIQVSIVRT